MSISIFPALVTCEVVDSLKNYYKDVQRINNSVNWQHYTSCATVLSGIIARVADAVVGYLAFDEEYLGVHYIAVDSDYKGKGVGYKLLAQAVQEFQAHGSSFLELRCRVDKVGGFYRNCGAKLGLGYEEMSDGFFSGGDRAVTFSFDLCSGIYKNQKAV